MLGNSDEFEGISIEINSVLSIGLSGVKSNHVSSSSNPSTIIFYKTNLKAERLCFLKSSIYYDFCDFSAKMTMKK